VSTIEEKVLALAGIFQSARLAQRLAYTNTVIELPFATSIYSILITEAKHTHDVFAMDSLADIEGLRPGLEAVRDKLGGNTDSDDFEVARYVIGMIQLAKKLNGDAELMQKLSDGIDTIATNFPPPADGLQGIEISEDLIRQIADLYSNTISHLSPRIIVNGDPDVLKGELAPAKIRAVLMAGIRAAHLWWQLGGRRWQVLFRRGQFSDAAARVLDRTATAN
jgi:high frequency lysogenization protein